MNGYESYGILFLLLILTACQTDTLIELPSSESKLVVSCMIEDGEDVLKVYVSKSLHPTDRLDIDPIEEAEVFMYVEDVLLDTFEFTDLGYFWYYHMVPINGHGKNFRLEVSSPDYPSVSSEQIMPFSPVIENIEYQVFGGTDEMNKPYDYARFDLVDRPGEEEFYEISFFYKDFYGSFYQIYTWTDDELPEEGYDNYYLVEDASFSGERKRFEFKLSTEFYELPMDEVWIKVAAVSKIKHDYSLLLGRHELAQYNPLSEPIIFPTNIENGEGLFSLEAITSMQIE